MVGGTYGAVVQIIRDSGGAGRPWSCADNSASVPVS